MKRLFIHHPLFRLLSPVFSGVIVYLLVLLINNRVNQIQEQFFEQELYVCIGLSYVIQEFSRLLLLLFKKLPQVQSALVNLLLQVVVSLLLSVVIVTVSLQMYYKHVLGYTASIEELWVLNVVFCIITLIYILLFISHQYLYKINTEKLQQEQQIKQHIEEDFQQFKRGVNPGLLFESFETLLVLIQEEDGNVDDFIDHLATLYRYILMGKERQLVTIQEELSIAEELVKLFNHLPYRTIKLEEEELDGFLTVPGSVLFVIEQIVRTTITSSAIQLNLQIQDKNEYFEIVYIANDRIAQKFQETDIEEIQRIYAVYSTLKIAVIEKGGKRYIRIPKLLTQPT